MEERKARRVAPCLPCCKADTPLARRWPRPALHDTAVPLWTRQKVVSSRKAVVQRRRSESWGHPVPKATAGAKVPCASCWEALDTMQGSWATPITCSMLPGPAAPRVRVLRLRFGRVLLLARRQAVLKLAKRLTHRGPDWFSLYGEPGLQSGTTNYMAHLRLAIGKALLAGDPVFSAAAPHIC